MYLFKLKPWWQWLKSEIKWPQWLRDPRLLKIAFWLALTIYRITRWWKEFTEKSDS